MFAGALLAGCIGCGGRSTGAYRESGVKVRMRDGTILRADVYRPRRRGTFPVLLERTPYDKSGSTSFALHAAAEGYVVVVQDVRGRYSSEGEWYPFKYESEDGFDTVEWAASLPQSNGKVGMFGGSYVGATQMLAAIAHPPHLAGICPIVTASNYHSNWVYQGGAFELWFNESWTNGLAQDTLRRTVAAKANPRAEVWKLPLKSYSPLDLPPNDLAKLTDAGSLSPYFGDWLAHPEYDDYWKKISIEDHYQDIQVPALTVAAWYDIFLQGSLRNYQGLRTHAGSESARRGQHLLVTIGGHSGEGRQIGDVDFGLQAAKYDEDAIVLGWYDYLFKGATYDFPGKKVTFFVMGQNEWREETSWPPQQARIVPYFLHAEKGARSVRGDGRLSAEKPHSETADELTYDPANPVPTVGGPLCCDSGHLAPGPRDQAPVETRDDVLVYTTGKFDRNVEVTGPVSLDLYAKSSARDTDFTAKLVDVWPNGFVQNLTEGIVRARYRDSQEKTSLLTPGQIYRLNIDMSATSNVFKVGHALRLEVSSSNFPRFDRNVNTGVGEAEGERGVPAKNTILHDAEHPSALLLSVMP